ncbi:hypothetical protein GBF38_000182 [Nibea albiflora]|nr:hypothetical protein GBF38_000182 [Nibea albiflora]
MYIHRHQHCTELGELWIRITQAQRGRKGPDIAEGTRCPEPPGISAVALRVSTGGSGTSSEELPSQPCPEEGGRGRTCRSTGAPNLTNSHAATLKGKSHPGDQYSQPPVAAFPIVPGGGGRSRRCAYTHPPCSGPPGPPASQREPVSGRTQGLGDGGLERDQVNLVPITPLPGPGSGTEGAEKRERGEREREREREREGKREGEKKEDRVFSEGRCAYIVPHTCTELGDLWSRIAQPGEGGKGPDMPKHPVPRTTRTLPPCAESFSGRSGTSSGELPFPTVSREGGRGRTRRKHRCPEPHELSCYDV